MSKRELGGGLARPFVSPSLTPFASDRLALLASLVSEVLSFVFHHSSELGFAPL